MYNNNKTRKKKTRKKRKENQCEKNSVVSADDMQSNVLSMGVSSFFTLFKSWGFNGRDVYSKIFARMLFSLPVFC